MTWPSWLAIGVAVFALGTFVDKCIGAAFDWTVAILIGIPILVVLRIWDAVASPRREALP